MYDISLVWMRKRSPCRSSHLSIKPPVIHPALLPYGVSVLASQKCTLALRRVP
jgi:hypothetical protein